MGTINYGTSNYITMGVQPEYPWEYNENSAIMDEMRELAEEWGCSVDEAISQNIQHNLEADIENVEWYLKNKYHFHYFHIAIIYGYYDGFYIDIENNYGVAYDSYEDKRLAQKEITEIKKFLLDCHDCGLCSVYPGWCTTYRTRAETERDINEAIKEMREEVKRTPTWRQYNRNCA